jgi:hypothetical protein
MNYSIPETCAAIEERIPEETIWGAIDKRIPTETTRAPETLVETADDDVEATTPADTNVHQVDMFAMANEQGMSNKEGDQDDSEGSTNNTVDDTTGHRPLDPNREKIHSLIDTHIEAGGTLTTVKVADLLGCTFISEPNETGEQM